MLCRDADTHHCPNVGTRSLFGWWYWQPLVSVTMSPVCNIRKWAVCVTSAAWIRLWYGFLYLLYPTSSASTNCTRAWTGIWKYSTPDSEGTLKLNNKTKHCRAAGVHTDPGPLTSMSAFPFSLMFFHFTLVIFELLEKTCQYGHVYHYLLLLLFLLEPVPVWDN